MKWVIFGTLSLITIIIAVFLINTLFFTRPSTRVITPIITPTPFAVGGGPPVIITTVPTPPPAPQITEDIPTVSPGTTKTLTHLNFSLTYPATWGLLTCSNSSNVELDPINSVDRLKMVCSVAQKPITLIVKNDLDNCPGETISLGNIQTIRSVTTSQNFVQYKWCTLTTPILEFTHRVSSIPTNTATTTSFVPEIESIISTLNFTTQ